MKKWLWSAVMVLLCQSAVYAGPLKYDEAKFSDTEKIARKIAKANVKILKSKNIKKLVILECYGEFVTSKEVSAGAFASRAAARSAANQGRQFYTTTTKTSTLDLDKDYYTNTVNRVYDIVTEIFKDNGIEIISTEEVGQNELYQTFNLAEEKAGRGVKSGMMSDTVVTKTQKVSATGLGLFPGPLGMIKVAMNVAEITHELGADGFLQINFRVDKGSGGTPILQSFNVLLSADIRGQEVGFKGNKKMRYDLYTQWLPILEMPLPIMNIADIAGPEKGSIDMSAYDKALMDVINSVGAAYKYSIANVLAQKK
ncbi:MAG: hypothetical protein ABII88_07690 [Candidatus Omnitrophota bacterium]